MYLHLVINRKKYKADASFLTLLRYRAQYGVSYLIDDSDEKWPRILYIAISPECSYIRFCKELSADSQFVLSALYLQKELLRCDREVSIQGEKPFKRAGRAAHCGDVCRSRAPILFAWGIIPVSSGGFDIAFLQREKRQEQARNDRGRT